MKVAVTALAHLRLLARLLAQRMRRAAVPSQTYETRASDEQT